MDEEGRSRDRAGRRSKPAERMAFAPRRMLRVGRCSLLPGVTFGFGQPFGRR